VTVGFSGEIVFSVLSVENICMLSSGLRQARMDTSASELEFENKSIRIMLV
jgi:hypothetical protein